MGGGACMEAANLHQSSDTTPGYSLPYTCFPYTCMCRRFPSSSSTSWPKIAQSTQAVALSDMVFTEVAPALAHHQQGTVLQPLPNGCNQVVRTGSWACLLVQTIAFPAKASLV
eukprot:scaffold138509_cov13-Tisochrysis_lutea.AAC.1